jgi:DNA-directed RNA polymerase specialized sigma24 family protein
MRDVLGDLLSRLPAPQQRVIELMWAKDMSLMEASVELKIGPQSTRELLQQAHDQLGRIGRRLYPNVLNGLAAIQ